MTAKLDGPPRATFQLFDIAKRGKPVAIDTNNERPRLDFRWVPHCGGQSPADNVR